MIDYKKLALWITVANVIAWLLLELWIQAYSDRTGSAGAAFLVFLQIAAYYAIVTAAKLDKNDVNNKIDKINRCKHHWVEHWDDRNYRDAVYCPGCDTIRAMTVKEKEASYEHSRSHHGFPSR